MRKIVIVAAVLSLTINILLVYVFVFKGETKQANDGRTAIIMTEGNRDFALSEMRVFLESLQGINEGVLAQDTQKIISAAKLSGNGNPEPAPQGLIKSLPIGFKTLGMTTHKMFDEIVEMNSKSIDVKATQVQVNAILNNCIACHKTYKIVAKK